MPVFRLVESASAKTRLDVLSGLLGQQPLDRPALILGASRGAADDLARRVAVSRPATFGLQRFTLTQLAARMALVELANRRYVPTSVLGAEAVATRAAHRALHAGSLSYFEPVAATPGFPRALARTVEELRASRIDTTRLSTASRSGRDLAHLLEHCRHAFAETGSIDRTTLLLTAAELARAHPVGGLLVLLDLPLDHSSEQALVAALVAGADTAIASAPHGDPAIPLYERMGAIRDEHRESGTGDLVSTRAFLFSVDRQPPERTLDGSLELYSAPGEGRECVEIARRIVREARAGVRFDDIAIVVRSPANYFGLLEHALHRAGIPAWFDRGTRRPHPAGRAFLALLACAAQRVSAVRFAEYLSLGQVPPPQQTASSGWTASIDDAFGRVPDTPDDERETEREVAAQERVNGDEPAIVGTLRTPWRWEKLLVDAAVVGETAARWKRRLDGYSRELGRQRWRAERDEGEDSAKVRAIALTLEQLVHLREFAMPVIETLAAWPARATWGEWLDRFAELAPRVLRTPAYVQRVLADLRPMADIGPVDLDEARRVLNDRLLTLETEVPSRRYGRVFVGTPQQVRGRSFRVVFIPGLAERLFPQKPREDPLLLDDVRLALDASLPTQRQRLANERLLLQLAVGAAAERLYVSYPRIELSESRARVPSFYALDLLRAASGRVPDHESLEERARLIGNATLSWPAPARPEEAIDDQEHDLAVLRGLLDEPNRAAVKGHAHYLLTLNEALRRTVTARWARGQDRWSLQDGLVRPAGHSAVALASQRLTARPYSLSALQRFTACPYQFVLSAIYRLQPLAQPEQLQRMDPLTRGSIFHDVQARFFRALHQKGMLPVTAANLESASGVLDHVVAEVASRAQDELAPAVERVWVDEIASLRRDLHAWLQYLARDGEEWIPRHFELAFGAVPGERDAESRREDVTLGSGFRLRGAVDLIEEHRQTKVLRVTDHKTGRTPDRIDRVIIGGGAVLQPVLYAMAVEAALARPVSSGRLFYCTATGSFSSHVIPLNDATREAGVEALEVIDRAIETGTLVAAPTADACDRCDFTAVCGRNVYRRIVRKPQDRLADLLELRSRP